jgi:hypothetical protein
VHACHDLTCVATWCSMFRYQPPCQHNLTHPFLSNTMSFAVPCLQVDQGDVILVFAYSHIVATVLCTAAREGKRFRVAVVDARPESEGRLMLKVGSNAYQHAVGVPHATNTRGVELGGGVGCSGCSTVHEYMDRVSERANHNSRCTQAGQNDAAQRWVLLCVSRCKGYAVLQNKCRMTGTARHDVALPV